MGGYFVRGPRGKSKVQSATRPKIQRPGALTAGPRRDPSAVYSWVDKVIKAGSRRQYALLATATSSTTNYVPLTEGSYNPLTEGSIHLLQIK